MTTFDEHKHLRHRDGRFAAQTHDETSIDLSPVEVSLAEVRCTVAGLAALNVAAKFTPGHMPRVGVDAIRILETRLPAGRAAELREARVAYEDSYERDAAANKLHAVLVDALDDAPTRAELAELDATAQTAGGEVTASSVARDMGWGAQEDVDQARERAASAAAACWTAREARRNGRLLRAATGETTVHDVQDADLLRRVTQDSQRRARLEADAARYRAVQVGDDAAIQHATLAQTAAEDAHQQACDELDQVAAAWDARKA